MLFNFGPRSSILLIFFFHGIVYACLLLHKSGKYSDKASKLLSLFTLLCCLYICPWMLGHAGWYANQPYRDILFYVPFQQVLFLGPIIYFYTQSLLNKSFKFSKTDLWHLLPGLCYLSYSIIVFVTDQLVLGEYYFYLDERDKDLSVWYQVAGLVSMLVYFVLSLRYYSGYKKIAFEVSSFADSILFSWIKRFLVAFLFMQIIRVLFLLLYPDWGSFADKWWYYFAFSLLFYFIAIAGYANTLQALIAFKPSLLDNEPTYLFDEEVKPTTQSSATSSTIGSKEKDLPDEDTETVFWKPKIEALVLEQKVFENPSLSLADIAKELETNPRVISRAINQGFQMNFNDFINFHRVEAVKQMLEQNATEHKTLLGIALDCGFNSKATFNRAFKKHVHLSPKEFLSQIGRN